MVLKRSCPAVSHCNMHITSRVCNCSRVQGHKRLSVSYNLQFDDLPIEFHCSDFLQHNRMINTRTALRTVRWELRSKDHLQNQLRWWICSSRCRYRPEHQACDEQRRCTISVVWKSHTATYRKSQQQTRLAHTRISNKQQLQPNSTLAGADKQIIIANQQARPSLKHQITDSPWTSSRCSKATAQKEVSA